MYCPYCDREIDDRESRCEQCGHQALEVSAQGESRDLFLSFTPLAARHERYRLRVPIWLYLTMIGALVTITLMVVLYAGYSIGVLTI